MYKIGLSTFSKKIDNDLFEDYKKNGIDAMEVSLGDLPVYSDYNYKKVVDFAKQYDIDLWSFHLPFYPFSEIDISRLDLSNKSISILEELIKIGSDMGIDKFIIHPSGEPIDDNEREERLKISQENLALLADKAYNYGATIAIENLPRTCLGKNSDEILKLIALNEKLKVCYDTNHLLNENAADFIHKVGNNIITTHVSDYDFIDERHWLPGEGKLDWQKLLKALKDINYNGVWLYEIAFETPNTIIRNRNLTCEDFSRNAKDLFDGKTPTVFSSPKETLGF